jgi:polyisoprenoid-binding protein YceI
MLANYWSSISLYCTMKKILFLFFILLASNAQAADKYVLDSSHTNITWIINHMGYSNTIGMFSDTKGTFVFDQESPEKSSLDVTVNANSIVTIVPKLTEHLKGVDFFNTEKFPEMKFVSTAIRKTGKKTGVVEGNLTMLGTTKPVKLKVTFNKAEKNAMTQKRMVGFSAETSIKRSDFGMSYGMPMVGDEVKLLIEAEGIHEDDFLLMSK